MLKLNETTIKIQKSWIYYFQHQIDEITKRQPHLKSYN